MIKFDCLLYYLHYRKSLDLKGEASLHLDEDAANCLLDALHDCHQSDMLSCAPHALSAFHYSKFWSENALSTNNEYFSHLEQVRDLNSVSLLLFDHYFLKKVLAVALFRGGILQMYTPISLSAEQSSGFRKLSREEEYNLKQEVMPN